MRVETASAAGGLDLSVGKPGDAGVRVASGVAGYLIGEGSDRAGQPLRHLVYSLALDPARAGLYVFDVR